MSKVFPLISLPPVPDKFTNLNEVRDFLNDLVQATYDPINRLQLEFNGKIELINQQVKEIVVSDTGLANTEFTVNHNLGRTPTYYWYTIDKAGTVYDSRRANWTTLVMYLKCSVANAALKIIVPI